jgi:SH3 domain protein
VIKTPAVILILLMSFLMSAVVSAQTTRYVSDELEIALRTGMGLEYRIRNMIPSGTRLQVLENDPSGYSKVITEGGLEGYVLTRYLSNSPSASERLAAAEQRVVTLELELAAHKEEIEQLSLQYTDSDGQNASLKETAQRLSKELDDLRRTASSAMALENENRQLKEKLQQIDHEIQALSIENNTLKDKSAKSWFLVGAAVLFGGILLGLIMPSLRMRKKNSWSNF